MMQKYLILTAALIFIVLVSGCLDISQPDSIESKSGEDCQECMYGCYDGKCMENKCSINFEKYLDGQVGAKRSVLIEGNVYNFELKDLEYERLQQKGKITAYFYINGQPTTPYGWKQLTQDKNLVVQTIPGTDIHLSIAHIAVGGGGDPPKVVGSIDLALDKECEETGCRDEYYGSYWEGDLPCCGGLKEIAGSDEGYEGFCYIRQACYYCSRCGDGICESSFSKGLYENKCNCPEDCDTGCTIFLFNMTHTAINFTDFDSLVTIDSDTYNFTLKGYEKGPPEKIYILINSEHSSPYGWAENKTYTIPDTDTDVLVKKITFHSPGYGSGMTTISTELYINKSCVIA